MRSIRIEAAVCGVLELVNRGRAAFRRKTGAAQIFADYASISIQNLLTRAAHGVAKRDSLTGLSTSGIFTCV